MYEPDEETRDAVSGMLATLGIAFEAGDSATYEAVFKRIDALYKADPDAILELFKATTVLATTLALKSFHGEGL